jgi:putative restriction endonuclease
MSRRNRDWTRDEHVIAFNLYCQIPFGRIHMGNSPIIEMVRLIGRSVAQFPTNYQTLRASIRPSERMVSRKAKNWSKTMLGEGSAQ